MKESFSFREDRVKLTSVIRQELLPLFFVIISFTLMVIVSYSYVSKVVENQIFANAQETVNTAEVTIRSDIREAEVALLQVEMLIENWLKWGESYDGISSYMALLADSMKFDNTWVRGFMNVYGIVNGNFMSGLYETRDPDEYVPEDRPWYHLAQAAGGRIGLSVPYTDWQTGKPVISLAKTMQDENGKNFGTIALDIDFSILSAYITSLHFAKGGYGVLCDENLNFIVHPFVSYINKSMFELNPVYLDVAQKLRKDPGLITTQRMVNDRGISVVIIFRQIYNGWFLGIATPVSTYYSDVNSMARTLSILGVFFMIILSLILIRLSVLKARSDEQNLGKSSFLARMSHEIRTPMNSILGMAELIRRKADSIEIQEYIEIIHQAGDNLLAIINDILDFSKIESGRLQLQNRDYQVASVLNDMINIMRPRVAEKSLDFFVDVDSAIPAQLFGDDMRLRQILTNLLSNAIKYTRKGFISLDVRMERMEGNTIKLICLVCDSGIGIKQEDLGRLFNEFVRIDAKVNQGIEGTGLGLVITRALCRAMGGDVTVSSMYGKGSVFRAVITQEVRNEEPVAVVNSPETRKVLFHDWRPQYVQSISNALESLGVKYMCSQGFQEFIRDLEHGQFDYAFVSSKYAMDCIFVLGRRSTPLQLVIMVEPGEMSVYQEVTSILMPVYSIPIANILNNESGGNLFHDMKLRINFTAPQAKILIVDDISTNLRVAKELMAPYNMIIHTCLSGSEALNLVKNNHYDIVFMDHMMPGMDGIEATSFIRSLDTGDGYYKNLPVIALTANALSGQKELFLENEINDFLAKPIDIQKLNDILEQWLPMEKRVEVTQSRRDDVKPDKSGQLLINGVNTELGLKNCGGTMAVYISILSDFCTDAEARLVQISETIGKNDIKLYTTYVHALKGAAMSIGAVEAGEEAAWLEKSADTWDISIIRDKTVALQENMHVLVNNIKTALEQHDAGNELIDISSLQLDNLKEALSVMDIKAVNKILLEYANLSLNAKTREMISEVEQHILMFEYDEAIDKINKFF